MVRALGYRSIKSRRSSNTEDATIAHLARATGLGQSEAECSDRADRPAKYNPDRAIPGSELQQR
jgi:enolase